MGRIVMKLGIYHLYSIRKRWTNILVMNRIFGRIFGRSSSGKMAEIQTMAQKRVYISQTWLFFAFLTLSLNSPLNFSLEKLYFIIIEWVFKNGIFSIRWENDAYGILKCVLNVPISWTHVYCLHSGDPIIGGVETYYLLIYTRRSFQH